MIKVLFILFAVSVAAQTPKRFVISDFGAVADSQTLNTKAIQLAIDKCAAGGGGVVVIPKGTFLSGAIFLKQGVNLYVEKDGVLKGSTNIDDYPMIPTRWEGTEEPWTSAFINAEGLTNLDISGEGTIDGSGDEWLKNNTFRRAAAGPTTPRRGRPRMIGIQNSKHVRVANLNLHNQAVWCLFFLYSEDVVADNLRITADHNIPSSDGIDIDSCKRVRVNNVYIDVNDDCISIKSGKDADGLRVNRPAEDILIENSHFAYGHGGVAMGSETSGGIRNVEVRNCVSDSGNWAPIRFKTQPSRGGIVENITYRDMTLHGTRQAFEFNLEWRMVPPIAPPAKVLPVVRNVRIINVSGDVTSVGVMHGLAGSPIQDVRFENCRITAQKGFKLDHARNVDLSGLKLDVKEGDAVTNTDVQFADRKPDDYTFGPDSMVHEGVPQGTWDKIVWKSEIFPNTERFVWTYVPAQYDPKKPACLMVFQDGVRQYAEREDNRPAGRKAEYRVPTVLDNLIARRELPVTIAVFIDPGSGDIHGRNGNPNFSNRSVEYDTLSDQYSQFLAKEILPPIEKKYNIRKDAAGRAIGGISSGAICAFTVAWNHPDWFGKVLSDVGSFTNIRGGHVYPQLVRDAAHKPLKIHMQDGTNDNRRPDNPERDWYLQNKAMHDALVAKGYDVKYVLGDGVHSSKHGGAILPDSLRWLWSDQAPKAIE